MKVVCALEINYNFRFHISKAINKPSPTLTYEPKPIHKIIIKSKIPGLTAKLIVTSNMHPIKDKIHLTFNKKT